MEITSNTLMAKNGIIAVFPKGFQLSGSRLALKVRKLLLGLLRVLGSYQYP